MSIQPGKAHVLGKGPESANPLVMLAEVMERQNGILSQIATNTAPEARHIYALHPVGKDTFLTYCLACSEPVNSPIYPCEDPAQAPPQGPPGTFTVSPDLAVSQRPDILSGD